MSIPTAGPRYCPICGAAHVSCGPAVAADVEKRAVDVLVRSGMATGRQQKDEPEQPDNGEEEREGTSRYRVQLEGNRGETVMNLTPEHAEKMGDAVLGPADEPDKPEPKKRNAQDKSKSTQNK